MTSWQNVRGDFPTLHQQVHGKPLVYLHGAGGLRISPALQRLSQDFHLYAFELPGFGTSPENTRSTSIQDLAASMSQAVAALCSVLP